MEAKMSRVHICWYLIEGRVGHRASNSSILVFAKAKKIISSKKSFFRTWRSFFKYVLNLWASEEIRWSRIPLCSHSGSWTIDLYIPKS